MDYYSYQNAGPYMVISTKTVLYSLSRCESPELYLDRRGAIKLAKTIEKLVPIPWIVGAIYHQYHRQRQPDFVCNDDALVERLTPLIFTHFKLDSGRDLYVINKTHVQQFTERADLEWRVTYEPGEDFDSLNQDIEAFLRENTEALRWLLHTNSFGQEHNQNNQITTLPPQTLYVAPQQVSFPPQPAFPPQSAFPSAPTYQQEPMYQQQPSFPVTQQPVTQQNLHAGSVRDSVRLYHQNTTEEASPFPEFESIPETARFSQDENTMVQSGYPSPVDQPTPLNEAIDSMFREMDRQSNRQTASNSWMSQFERADEQAPIDKSAAEKILSKMKVLAINAKMTKCNPNRFSIQSEKEAIKSMTINTSLNTPSSNSSIAEKMSRLFTAYDVNDEEGNESFQRAMLMIAVTLIRHEFLYQNGKKQPGNYATDFEKVYHLPAGYLQKAGHLCRIVVACGHPCIVVVLVRLAIRNRMTLGTLLEQLPITHFCRFVASGKVTDLNSHGNDTTHDDLKWIHENVLLPLLQVASHRVQDQLSLVNGTLVCDQDSCLRAIVHHRQQVKYTQFLNGYHVDKEWARGRVLLENRNIERDTRAEYSIERDWRTVSRFKLEEYSHTNHFPNPRKFLQSKTLEMSLDG